MPAPARPEVRQQALARALSGEAHEAIAAELGIAARTIRQWLKREGLTRLELDERAKVARRGRPRVYSDAQRAEAYERYLTGETADEIAAAVGCSAGAISGWISKGGWKTELHRRRSCVSTLEAEIARVAGKPSTHKTALQLSCLTRSMERLRKLAPPPRPRPLVAQAVRRDLLERALAEDYGLYPYQREFLQDEARYRVVLKARQIGFTYVMGLAVLLGLAAGRHQVVVSASEDQARLVFDHLRAHAQRLEIALDDDGERELRLGAAKAVALSTNWRTAQGYTGDVWFDEFAWAQRPDRLWGAVLPSITQVGGRVTVCSTPFTPGNLFWKIAENHQNRYAHFSARRITIHDAVAQGMPLPGGLEELRLNFDAESWAMFYECQWAEDGAALLSWGRLDACADELTPDASQVGRLTLGVDVGRVHDRTALVLVGDMLDPVTGRWGDTARVLAWEELRGMTFAAQRGVIGEWMRRWPVERIGIDRTGLGMQLAEELSRDYPGMVDAVSFTAVRKERLALGLLRLVEQGRLKIPRDPDLFSRLHAVKRHATGHGIRYDAARDEAGHADAFWALALAVEGRSQGATTAVEVWS